jgi:hypothetical protein
MPYNFEYTNELKQFGMTYYVLKLIDSDGILPDIYHPVIVDDNNLEDGTLQGIANKLIQQNTPKINTIS